MMIGKYCYCSLEHVDGNCSRRRIIARHVRVWPMTLVSVLHCHMTETFHRTTVNWLISLLKLIYNYTNQLFLIKSIISLLFSSHLLVFRLVEFWGVIFIGKCKKFPITSIWFICHFKAFLSFFLSFFHLLAMTS